MTKRQAVNRLWWEVVEQVESSISDNEGAFNQYDLSSMDALLALCFVGNKAYVNRLEILRGILEDCVHGGPDDIAVRDALILKLDSALSRFK